MLLGVCCSDAVQSAATRHGITRGVVKPTVSDGGYNTFQVHDAGSLTAAEVAAVAGIGHGAVLVQEFMHEVVASGELSLVFFDSVFQYAVRKRPAAGEFRVQQEHGGTSEATTVSAAVVAQVRRVEHKQEKGVPV